MYLISELFVIVDIKDEATLIVKEAFTTKKEAIEYLKNCGAINEADVKIISLNWHINAVSQKGYDNGWDEAILLD